MRLEFWHWVKERAQAIKPAMGLAPAPATPTRQATPTVGGDIELRALGDALSRNRRWILLPTLAAALLSITIVNLITPRYKSEARILIDGRENVFLRPNGDRNGENTAL